MTTIRNAGGDPNDPLSPEPLHGTVPSTNDDDDRTTAYAFIESEEATGDRTATYQRTMVATTT